MALSADVQALSADIQKAKLFGVLPIRVFSYDMLFAE